MGLLKKLRKVAKTVTKPVASVVQKASNVGPLKTVKAVARKGAAIQQGLVTGGLIKPKALGITNAKSVQYFRIAGNVSKVVAVAAGAVAVAPALGITAAGAKSAALTGAKFIGKAAIKPAVKVLTGRGGNPDATVDTRGGISPDFVRAEREQRLAATSQEKTTMLEIRAGRVDAPTPSASVSPLLVGALVLGGLYLVVR